MNADAGADLVTLDTESPIWERFFTLSPLVLVGTREADGRHDLAPKHRALALGRENYFGFVCTPEHRTYHNARREGTFTVSFPRPTQVVLSSLAAAPRCGDDSKPSLLALPTFPATRLDGVLVRDAYLYLECRVIQAIDGLGDDSLVIGRVVAAHAPPEALRGPDRDDADLIAANPLLAYLHPGRFARVRESYAFPYSVELDE